MNVQQLHAINSIKVIFHFDSSNSEGKKINDSLFQSHCCYYNFRSFRSYQIVPPDEPRIFDTHGKEITTIAGPFRESQEFFLSCQVSGGNPAPKVSWWRSDVEIPGTSHHSIVTGAIINNILMRAIPRDYYATKLICRAQGSPLIDPVEKEVTVQLHCKLNIGKNKQAKKIISQSKSKHYFFRD